MGFARYRPAALLMVAAAAAASCGGGRRPTPTPTPVAAAVTGRVVKAGGEALAGAVVVLTSEPDDGRVPIATVKTSAQGTFRIARVPAGRYGIRARCLGCVDAVARVLVAPPRDTAIELKVSATVSLAGRIQDSRGTPVPLARVLAFAIADATSLAVHETRADEGGGFTVLGLNPGVHRLLIEAPGLGTASTGPVQAPDPNVVVILPGQIRAILGRVMREGQPAAGARVLLGGEAMVETRDVEANAEGRFAFTGLGPGSYALRAQSGGWVSAVKKQVVLERPAAAPPSTDLVLALAPGGYIQGQVTGDGDRPLAGAAIQIDLVPATGLWAPVSSDGGGKWTSPPLAAGTYRLRAGRQGFIARRTVAATVPAIPTGLGRTLDALAPKLELTQTGAILGRVLDEQGKPVVGATVHDRSAETEELGVIWARLPLAAEAAAMPPGAVLPAMPARALSRRARSDTDGRFVLDDVPPGRVQVEVLDASSVPLRTHPVNLAPGTRLDLGTLAIQRAVEFRGQVVDPSGRPVMGARVSAAAPAGVPDAASGLYAVTDAAGLFSLPLSVGGHRLTATAPGYRDDTVQVPVSGGGVGTAAASPFILRLELERR